MGTLTDRVLAQTPEAAALHPDQREDLRRDMAALEYDTEMLLHALAALRTGAWDGPDPTDHGAGPGGAQRQLMQTALYGADQALPRIEAIRALALHGLRTHHGASHEDIARMLGVSRATAQARWRAIEAKKPPMWHWALGDTETSDDVCDGESVGIIVQLPRGSSQVLVFDRARFPWGVAGPAGHVRPHGTLTRQPGIPDQPAHRAAAVAELAEEVGLQADPRDLEHIAHGRMNNRCRRSPMGETHAHWWNIYRLTRWSGRPRIGEDEVKNLRWVDVTEIHTLAHRTLALAQGRITPEEFRADPGAEPAWVRWWRDARMVLMSEDELAAIEALAAAGPQNED